MAYFPLFIDLERKPCLVAGGGRVALRKTQALLDFGADVTVVSPVIAGEIRQIKNITVMEREFTPEDLEGKILVAAATDDASVNHEIGQLCKKKGIWVNAADQPGDCTFFFPAYVRRMDVVAAFSSGGKSPALAQYLKAREEEMLPEYMGGLNELLGKIRDRVKRLFHTEEERKRVYQEILNLGIRKQSVPAKGEVETLITKHGNETIQSKGAENGACKETEKQ